MKRIALYLAVLLTAVTVSAAPPGYISIFDINNTNNVYYGDGSNLRDVQDVGTNWPGVHRWDSDGTWLADYGVNVTQAVAAAVSGDTVTIGPGTYEIGDPWAMRPAANTHIKCAGMDQTILWSTNVAAAGSLVQFFGLGPTWMSDVSLEDRRTSGAANSDVVQILSKSSNYFYNVKFVGYHDGIAADQSAGPTTNTIYLRGCIF